jgi:hypothetical protein
MNRPVRVIFIKIKFIASYISKYDISQYDILVSK